MSEFNYDLDTFRIIGLFDSHDIEVVFNDNKIILYGDNGIGKTHILNILYFILNDKLHALRRYNFESVIMTFVDRNNHDMKYQFTMLKETLVNYDLLSQLIMEHLSSLRRRGGVDPLSKISVINDIFRNSLDKLTEGYRDYEYNLSSAMREIDRNLEQSGIMLPTMIIHRIINTYTDNPRDSLDDLSEKDQENELSNKEKEFFNFIKEWKKDKEILYFPTFRRVEEELYQIPDFSQKYLDTRKETQPHVDGVMQFGMGDVENIFTSIQDKINSLLKKGMAQFTNDILNIAIGINTGSNSETLKLNDTDLEMILLRAGSSLTTAQKDKLKTLHNSKSYDNNIISTLLQKLNDIYDSQKKYDNAIKNFRDICNKYLTDKSVVYDEKNIEITVKRKFQDVSIPLKLLSSGEKQIISIFSKLFLSSIDKKFIILFDEPELSLGVVWQQQLLQHIIDTGKCDFLLVVTHSPFIIPDVLTKYSQLLQISSKNNKESGDSYNE